MKSYDVSIGRAWSTFRVEVFQDDESKICASADIVVTDFSILGISLNTGWRLTPESHPVNLLHLESDADDRWACYHTAFYPNGYRRAHSYVKHYVPKKLSFPITFVEQWITPGWDCKPAGSRDDTLPEARFTNEMIQFIVDMALPVQENFMPQQAAAPHPLGSIAATLEFSAEQTNARKNGEPNWRKLENDGSTSFRAPVVNASLKISSEIKKKLPKEGVRWLYIRIESKSIRDGRMDQELLLLDERMELIAISHQVAQLIPAMDKTQRKASL